MIDYRKEGGVHVITMTAEASTICPQWQQIMLEHLDTVEADCGQGTALVLAGEGKFFCNGLNLEVVATLDAEAMGQFAHRSGQIHKRFLELPCPT
ncbi:MAG: enoyl-CoA hydratase/isomerase family protein, partial [Halieaceae bacterium]